MDFDLLGELEDQFFNNISETWKIYERWCVITLIWRLLIQLIPKKENDFNNLIQEILEESLSYLNDC